MVITWKSRNIRSLFLFKDKNDYKSRDIYQGVCSCGSRYIGVIYQGVCSCGSRYIGVIYKGVCSCGSRYIGVIYQGVCSCGSRYIGETKRNAEVRC